MKTLKLFKALSLTLLALPLVGCDGGTQTSYESIDYEMPDSFDDITLHVWDSISGQDGAAYGEMIEEFNNEYLGQIYIDRIPNATSTDYYNNIELSLTTNNYPDVVQTGNDIVAQWGYQGNVLADVTPIFEAIGKPIDESEWDTNIIDSAKWDGTLLEVPMGIHGTVLYINDTVWDTYFPDEEQPEVWTRDLVKEYGSRVYELSSGKVYGLPMSNQFPGNTYGQFDAFYQNGGSFTLGSEDWTVNFNTEAGKKGIQSFTDIIFNKNNEFGGALTQIGNDTDLNWFCTKEALFCVDGTWCLPNLYSAVESSTFEWHAAPISGLYALDPSADYADSILVQSHNLGITQKAAADNDKACAAAVFIDWMTEHCIEYCAAGHIAARKSVRETDEYKALPHHSEFGDPSNFVLNESNPAVLYMQGSYSSAMADVMAAGTNDDATVQGNLDKYQKEAEQNIEFWLENYE